MLKKLWILSKCKCHSITDQSWSWKSSRVFSFLKQTKIVKKSGFGEQLVDHWQFQSRYKAFNGNGKLPWYKQAHVGWLHNALQISSGKCIHYPVVTCCRERNPTCCRYQDSDIQVGHINDRSSTAKFLVIIGKSHLVHFNIWKSTRTSILRNQLMLIFTEHMKICTCWWKTLCLEILIPSEKRHAL